MGKAMSVQQKRVEAQGMFAFARRVLSGKEAPVEAPVDPVDIRSGIDRALRQARRSAGSTTLAETAARAVSTVEGTLVAIDTIHTYLSEALELTAEALAHPDETKRAMIADRYEELRSRIDTVAAGATFEGVNLIDGARAAIEVMLPEGGQPRHAIGHITLVAGEKGLSLKAPSELFASNDEVEAARLSLFAARQRLDRAAETFLNQASLLAPCLGATPDTGEA
jgi:flagellin-like hook-associated protein FlgL